jgi:oligopeptide transport system substrate-binding protein
MKNLTSIVIIILLTGLIASCGNKAKSGASTKDNTISCVFGSEPNTIDPALNSAVDGAIYLSHAFEGLYKYDDSGIPAYPGLNHAQVVPGLAAGEPAKTVNADGTVTLVFTLRGGLKWSDGSPFTADDIVYSWQRLVDPETTADYCYMLDMVLNADEIMADELDKGDLGVKALNETTLEVKLTYDCPYFDEIMAFPATFPVKRSIIESSGDQWTFSPQTYVSNGPYKMKEWVHNSYLLFEKNPHYYAPVAGPEYLRFALMDDDNAVYTGFRSGELDFIEQVPIDEVPTLFKSGDLIVANYLGTYYISFNTQKAPFDNANVRQAFSLAVDRNFIVENVTRTGQKPAGGFVPAGMSDAEVGSDFRKIGGDYVSVAAADYQRNIAEAQRLLALAGYPEGRGFPVVEYLYNTSEGHRAIAETLQNMWRINLGVNVTLGNQDWAVFLDTRKKGNYSIARDGWIGDYNDPIGFLDQFRSGGGNNNPQYAVGEFDDFIARAKGTAVQADRMRYMHQAEDILVGRDAAVAPLYFYTQSYMINPRVHGFYTPLGYFFFMNSRLE